MEMGVKAPVAVTPAALERLINYEWPGNVREMENMVERELIQNKSGSLLFDSLTTQKRKEQINFNKNIFQTLHLSFDTFYNNFI